ncbi:MAG: helix-turn-helix domain-containing protein [Candidatus Falkowbacteria bacterium]|nr:helix-turn-helix domain-containing protein [Candidatus Falkowbacteria bacterium]
MPTFTPKKLALEDTIGEKLRQARHNRQLNIEPIAKKLKIRAEYLMAMEDERFDKLPAGLYGKNFLKEYALFLGLKPPELFKDLDDKLFGEENSNPFSQKVLKSRKLLVWPKIIKNILIAATILICFLYLIFYFKNIITAPDLTITQPDKNILTKASVITIFGQTEPEAEVRINGEIVLNNNKGVFSQTVNLKKGLNSLTISAQKKYSRAQSITRQILVE